DALGPFSPRGNHVGELGEEPAHDAEDGGAFGERSRAREIAAGHGDVLVVAPYRPVTNGGDGAQGVGPRAVVGEEHLEQLFELENRAFAWSAEPAAERAATGRGDGVD